MELINAVGRRKAAVARVYFKKTEDKKGIKINGRDLHEYFPIKDIAQRVMDPLTTVEKADEFGIHITVAGGGLKGQVEAI